MCDGNCCCSRCERAAYLDHLDGQDEPNPCPIIYPELYQKDGTLVPNWQQLVDMDNLICGY